MFKQELSIITKRLQICGEGDRVELEMLGQKFCVALVRDLGPMIILSNVSQFTLESWRESMV